MCNECHQYPRCPNAAEPKVVFICSGCSHDIYEGQHVWHIMGEQFCKRCMIAAREVAIFDGPK